MSTGVCGDLDPTYQIPAIGGSEDPRVVYDKYTEYFYNFAYGKAVPGDDCEGPGAPGACTVVLSRTKTPAIASSWQHVKGQPAAHRSYALRFLLHSKRVG